MGRSSGPQHDAIMFTTMFSLCSALTVAPNALVPIRARVLSHPSPIASSPSWRRAGLGGPFPEGYSLRIERENLHSKMNVIHSKNTRRAADMASAVATVTACALAGVALSAAQADTAISMMGSTGLFNYDALFTDIVVEGVDVANAAGWALLPVSFFFFAVQTQEALLADEQAEDEVGACLVDEVAGKHICGHASFDSADGMVCIEDYSNGKLRWVCA